MKNDLYDICFGLDHVEVYATSPLNAAILAVARRIKEGKTTTIDQIYDVERDDSVIFSRCIITMVEAEE